MGTAVRPIPLPDVALTASLFHFRWIQLQREHNVQSVVRDGEELMVSFDKLSSFTRAERIAEMAEIFAAIQEANAAAPPPTEPAAMALNKQENAA